MNAHKAFFSHWSAAEFKLPDSFIEAYKQRPVPWGFGDLSYITFKRSYARPLDPMSPNGPTEEWWQTCRRVIEGTITAYICHDMATAEPGNEGNYLPEFFNVNDPDWPEKRLKDFSEDMYERMFTMKWLPPGRGLYAMGTAALVEKGAGCLNNCMFVTTAPYKKLHESFRRLMDFSMLGVGVGFDTRGAELVEYSHLHVDGSLPPFIVQDTREGWCDLVAYILDGATNGTRMAPGYKFGQVRPKGAPLRTHGGTASGPEPLIGLVTWLLKTFGCKVTRHGLNLLVKPRKMGPDLVFTEELLLDIGTQIGHCVVMGGIRRTALICFGHKYGALPTAKHNIGDKVWRYRSNNSVFVQPGDAYEQLATETQKFGEPGYFWLETARAFGRLEDDRDDADDNATGANPCMEQTLFDDELCCLVETFPARAENEDDFRKTLLCAYMYAKAVTLLPTHDPVVNEVTSKNRRMGISMAGIVQAIEKWGSSLFFELCDKLYRWLRDVDVAHSRVIQVNPSIKLTSVKPGGTVPLLPGATPGMHWDHAPYYIRRERFSDDSPYLKDLADAGYTLEVCEDDPSAVAVSFPVKSNEKEHKPEVSADDQMKLAADLQRWWADNQVSVTVHFRPHESVLELLQKFDTRLKGVSFLPYFDDTAGDMPYRQLPYETIDEATYTTMMAKITPLANREVHGGHEVTDAYCDGESCRR